MANRSLFVSFTGALEKLADGTVTDADLADGLFYFGCVRDHVEYPAAPVMGGYVCDERTWYEGGHEAHVRLWAAVRKAEAEGRVLWRTLEDKSFNAHAFLHLLQDNGVPKLAELAAILSDDASYHEIGDALAEAGVSLRVVHSFMETS